MRQRKRQNASPLRDADSHAGTKTIDTMSTRNGSIVIRVTSTATIPMAARRRPDKPKTMFSG
jgi:hypothetical protein